MFLIIFPLTLLDAAGSTHGLADAIPFIVNKLPDLLVAVGPQHFAVLAVSLAILPKPLVLPAITPFHDTFAVHDVYCKCAYLL